MHASVLKLNRMVAGHVFDADRIFSDDDVIHELKAMCPSTMLKMARLLTCIRVVSRAPAFVFDLALVAKESKASWISAVKCDLKWICTFPAFAQCRQWSLQEWITAMRHDSRKYRKGIVDECRSAYANIHVAWAVNKSLVQIGTTFQCDLCDKSFNTKQALSVHRYKAHGSKRPQRLYVDTTHCEVCMVEFWTRERLVCHLAEKSHICWANYICRPPKLSEEQADVLDSADAEGIRKALCSGLRRQTASMPCIRLAGSMIKLTVNPTNPSAHHALGLGRRHLGT